ncbi:hypothetical protein V6N13_064145 [Hibiscus sabdariffa]|uniref:Pru domain-containing protein n=1 Tax=Hibiscus sabdariffa TaxID=183260 RepID=A0ABR2R286_9ROSI
MQEAELHDLSTDADSTVSQQEILKEMEKMSSSFAEAFPAMQETLLEFRAGKMLLEEKRVVPDTCKGLICIAREPKAVDDSQSSINH